jgi:hypothetical protein
MDNVPPALPPSRPAFNNKSNNTVRVNTKDYQMKTGNLVFYLPIRFDIYRNLFNVIDSIIDSVDIPSFFKFSTATLANIKLTYPYGY